jgi:hypothetical protein
MITHATMPAASPCPPLPPDDSSIEITSQVVYTLPESSLLHKMVGTAHPASKGMG